MRGENLCDNRVQLLLISSCVGVICIGYIIVLHTKKLNILRKNIKYKLHEWESISLNFLNKDVLTILL